MVLFSCSVAGRPDADCRGESLDGGDAVGAVSGVAVLHAVTASSSATAGTARAQVRRAERGMEDLSDQSGIGSA